MKKIKNVVFRVTSNEGDSEFSMLPKQALSKIKQLEKEANKWVFIGGEHKKSETLTESDLIEATTENREIMLVTGLAGGFCDMEDVPEKAVEIEFLIEKDVDNIVIDFEENDYAKIITIVMPEEKVVDILHNRELIVRALKRKLENLAESQVSDLKMALKV